MKTFKTISAWVAMVFLAAMLVSLLIFVGLTPIPLIAKIGIYIFFIIVSTPFVLDIIE